MKPSIIFIIVISILGIILLYCLLGKSESFSLPDNGMCELNCYTKDNFPVCDVIVNNQNVPYCGDPPITDKFPCHKSSYEYKGTKYFCMTKD